MLNKKYLVAFLSIILLFSCNNEADKNNDELNKVKSFIVEEYFKYDSINFNRYDNCYFQTYVRNEINDLYFDHYVKDIGIKYFHCPYNNFDFVLLKSDCSYYYYGISDPYIYRAMLESKYEEKYDSLILDNKKVLYDFFKYKSKTDSMELYDDINGRGTSVLNEMINKNNRIKTLLQNSEKELDLSEIFALIYYINQSPETSLNHLIYSPYFKLILDFKGELFRLKSKEIKNDSVYNYLIKKYDKPGGLINTDKHTYFLKMGYLGIFIYNIIRKDGIIKINRQFIPEKRLPNLMSGKSIPPYAADCPGVQHFNSL